MLRFYVNIKSLRQVFCFIILFISYSVKAECDLELDPFCEDVDVPLDIKSISQKIIALSIFSIFYKHKT